MITVHHLNNSRSQRVLWMLEEIGIEYEIAKYDRDAETMRAPASLRAVHPLGKSPVITDGDITVAESGAIIEYLASTYAPQLKPDAGTPEYRDWVYWLHFAEGSLMPPLLVKLIIGRLTEAKVPFFVKPVIKAIANQLDTNYTGPEIKNLLTYINEHLEGRDWLVGDALSAADIQMSFPLEAGGSRSGMFALYPNVKAYVDRIHARPAYKAALERGGAYDFAS